MHRCMLGLFVFLAISGCSKSLPHDDTSVLAAKPAAPVDPEHALYEQVRSGAYQISSAIDSIEDVRKTAKQMASHQAGSTKKALLTIEKGLDDAGDALSDYSDDPPPFDEFKKEFAVQDDRRLKAIAAGTASLVALNNAQDLLDDLIDSHPPEPMKTELDNADSAMDECIQAVEEAVKAMGGKVASL